MNTLKCLMDYVSRNVLKIVFSIIFIGALVIKAMYSFDDSPYFTHNNLCDYVMIIVVCVVLGLIIKFRNWLNVHMNYKLCCVAFFIISLLYILMVPLEPFSDMAAVYRGALKFARFEISDLLDDNYWKLFPGNILLAVFWGIILIPLPKCLITIKICNIIFIYLIVLITRNIAKVYGVRYYNIVYLLMLTFIPLLLYSNHVYFDLPVMFLCLLAIYLFVKGKNILLVFGILGVGQYIRLSVSIFMLAILIVYIFNSASKINKSNIFQYIKRIGLSLIVFVFLGFMLPRIVQKACFGDEKVKSYSGWNQIYIGLNEEEFGFMDNDFSYDRSFSDIINRVKAYGPYRLSKILTKKTFWLWSQGTYQAERYGFGGDVSIWSEKFSEETILTNYLLNSGQLLRKIINSLMRAQYLAVFLLMICEFWNEKNMEQYRLFYYLFFATFLIMIVYEMKSRYILHLLPMMVIFAVRFIEEHSFLKNKKMKQTKGDWTFS